MGESHTPNPTLRVVGPLSVSIFGILNLRVTILGVCTRLGRGGRGPLGEGGALEGFGGPPDPPFCVTPPQRRTRPLRSATGTRNGGRRSTRGPRGRSWNRAEQPRWAPLQKKGTPQKPGAPQKGTPRALGGARVPLEEDLGGYQRDLGEIWGSPDHLQVSGTTPGWGLGGFWGVPGWVLGCLTLFWGI